jgi:hypothetical protein
VTDSQLRELERSARAGDPQAEERLLVARLRAGTLEHGRAELAAVCGSPIAIRALGSDSTDGMPLSVILATVARAMTYAPERDPVPWKEAGVLAACAMVEVAQRHHHASRRGVYRVGEPAHQEIKGRRPRSLRRRGPHFVSCNDVTCDLALRCLEAARMWVDDMKQRHDHESLCWSLARMGPVAPMRLESVRFGEPFRQQRIEGLDWPAVPCAMAAHEGGRPDLLARLHERVRRVPFERRDVEAAVRLDAELRAAVCRELVVWALA